MASEVSADGGGDLGMGTATWIPDGARLAFSRTDPSGVEEVAVRRLDGAGGEHEIYRTDHPLFVSDVTADARTIVFSD